MPATPANPPTLRQLLWREFALVAAVFVPLAVAVSWIGYVQVLDLQSGMLARQAASSLEARLDDRLDRIHRGAELLSSLWRAGVIDPALAAEARIHLAPLLRSLPGKGNILLVRSPDGVATVGVRDSDLAIESVEPLPDGTARFTERFYDREHDETPPMRTRIFVTPYRPLERPWVKQVESAGGATWTDPYEFASFVGGGGPRKLFGLTYGEPVRRGETLLGYVGIDLLLADLDTLAAAVRPTPQSLVEIRDAAGTLLGASSSEVGTRAAHHESLLLEAMHGHKWRVELTIPDSELSGPTRRQLGLLAGAVLVLFLLAALRMRAVGGRVVDSLRELSVAAGQLGVAAPSAAIDAPTAELATVRDALQRSHEGVQERRELEHQLQHSQRVGLVGFLAGGLAHDLNNQLTVVTAGVADARAALAKGGPAAPILAEAEQAAWRCVDMTRGMLNLSRRDGPALQRVELNSVVEGAAALVRRVVDTNVRVELDLAHGLPHVEGDPVQLEQVLLNLAINARDAMPAGGVLTFQTRPALPSGVQLVVRDTGTGVPPDVKERMFEPFFTTKPPGQGTGLGLAMVRSIVGQHGGSIDVESTVGRGTAFRLVLGGAAA